MQPDNGTQLLVTPRRTKVAICGFAKPHRDLAPFHDPEWEIWPVNDAWGFVPEGTATRWFEIHSPWIYEWELRRAPGHVAWLRQFGAKGGIVYLLDERKDVLPHAVRYPLEQVMMSFPQFGHYLTSSIAYMLALAIAEGFEEIGVWGVDMAAESEYADQRPACEYFIGVAVGRGIKVTLPEGSKLMQGPMYGRGWLNPLGERITENQLATRLKMLERGEQHAIGICDQNLSAINQVLGAKQALRQLLAEAPQMGPEIKKRIEGLEGQERQFGEALGKNREQLQLLRGAISETRRWIGLTPEGGDPRFLPAVQMRALPEPIPVEAERPAYGSCIDARCSTSGGPAGTHGLKSEPLTEQNRLHWLGQQRANGDASEAMAVTP